MRMRTFLKARTGDWGSRSLKRVVIPRICCPKCKGTGEVQLSDEMWTVLNTVKWLGETDAEEMAKQIQWQGHVTAINNRLKDLMLLGFLKRSKMGKRWIYSAV